MTSRSRPALAAALAALAAATAPPSIAPAAAQALGGQWYAGVGGGASLLEPNSEIGLDVDENAGTADDAPPERPDSDADMQARAEGAPETTVEVEGRDAELERLLEEIDRELLGDSPPTRAVDVGLPIATVVACPEAAGERYRTGVLFRHGSAAIKGRSLTRIDELLTLWRACGGGEIRVEPNPQGDADGDEELARRRRDEVKYYLLQRRVPGADIAFGERS